MREFKVEVAVESWLTDMGDPVGSILTNSSSSSKIAFSAMGFLLGFLNRPISKIRPLFLSGCVFARLWKPGAGSMRRVDVGLSAGWRGSMMEQIPSSKCSAFSDLMNVVAVKEDTDSLAIRINCLLLRSTSIENDWPIWLGGAEVENSVTCLGMRFTDAHL